MHRHAFRALIALAAVLWFATLSAGLVVAPVERGRVQHVVMLWLKEPGNAEARAKLIRASLELQSIPGVLSIAAGAALPSERPLVDDSFDVGVVFVFESAEAMHAYLAHPDHQRTVAEVVAPVVDRMLVYDFVE